MSMLLNEGRLLFKGVEPTRLILAYRPEFGHIGLFGPTRLIWVHKHYFGLLA